MAVASEAAVYGDVVGSGMESRRHPLLEKGTFEQLQRNDIIETRPHILHFGGYQLHKEHSHVLRILNISPSSLRLAIIAPATPHFRIAYDKKGLLAPGMSEDIIVTFTPHEWRYYHDTVKIHCGDLSENLVVPIHAYPAANDVALPRIVDFGNVAIGKSRTREIPLSCKIPIKFEFEITVLESHPDIDIAPLAGIIPPDGTTSVHITFTPSNHRTAHAEVQFNIAQFDFEPITVTIVGSCVPDLHRKGVLEVENNEVRTMTAQTLHDTVMTKMGTLRGKRGRKPIETKMPAPRADQQSTNHVPRQTAGKMPLKDLSGFIREQREMAERRRRKAEASTNDDDAEGADADDDDRQAVELRFEMRYREVAKYDQDKELKSMVAIGEDPPTQDEVDAVLAARRERHARLLQSRIRDDTARVQSVLSQEPLAVPIAFKPASAPHWDENANDIFSMRLQVIDRFVRAGSKCLMQVRARRRLQRLVEALRGAGVADRASCKAWVESENKAFAAGLLRTEDDREGALLVVDMPVDFVLPPQIPTSQALMSTEDRQPVEVMPLDNFETFPPASTSDRLDYKVLQYEHYAAPPPPAYMKLNEDRPKYQAALEELSVRGTRGDAFDGAEAALEMPASCLLPPLHDPLSLLVPSTSCRTFVGYPDAAECDIEYRLSQMAPSIEPFASEPLLPPDLLTLEEPMLGTWRRVRRLREPFEHFDPMPGYFVEGGGPYGPRLGSDFGGERLSFLPVGGFERDIPSDTDSDEREDFEMPVPGEEEFQRALRQMQAPISSDLWTKQREAEERLQRRCDANNRVVRERLRELNKDLDSRNKLYLG